MIGKRNGYAAWRIIAGAVAGLLLGASAVGEEAGLKDFLTEGTLDFGFRYRYEFVDQDGLSEEARASTLRSRATLQSGRYRGFTLLVEVDDVREIGADEFNAGAGNTPDRTRYPIVADPEGTEVNQAYVDYTGSEYWSARLGRQRFNFDNQRFVGGVGWRQNEQTFEAFNANYRRGIVRGQYAYVTKVRRIFGDDVAAGKHDQDGTHLLNVSADVGLGKLTAYYYGIDNEDAPADSTATTGLRFSGDTGVEDLKLRYTAEYASQRDAANNPVDFHANYWSLDAGVVFDDFDVGLGWEVLSGDSNKAGAAFRTPLATLHAFQGWADVFLATPDAGIDDRYAKFRATPGKAIVQIRYHTFATEDGGTDLGDEWDVQVGYTLTERLRADLFLASYDGDGGIADTDKLWVMFTLKL